MCWYGRRVLAACLAGAVAVQAFVVPPVATPMRSRMIMSAAAGDEEWRNIVGSEANLGTSTHSSIRYGVRSANWGSEGAERCVGGHVQAPTWARMASATT